MVKNRFFLFFLGFLFLSLNVDATHLRGGEITVTRDDCQSLTARITITVYVDTESTVPFGNGILFFGDGEDITIPNQTTTPVDLGNNVGKATFSTTYTYKSPGFYTIAYREANRNAGILNIPNSVRTMFTIETKIAIDPSIGCNNSPVLRIPPIDDACGGVTFFHLPGASDPDGDSLSYELVVPKSDPGVVISGYRFPDDPSLYPNPGIGNEAQDGPATFTIDPVTGLITWDAPPVISENAQGAEYNFAFIVREWRRVFGEWRPLGFVRRDMQVIVEECDHEKPELEVPEDLCVEAGTLIEAEIFGFDPDKDSVKIELFSPILEFEGSPASYEPANNPFQLIQGEAYQGKVDFTWQTDCSHVRDQPYTVAVKVTDHGGPRLTNFETWNIRVIGPAPEINPVTDATTGQKRQLEISWDPYVCENANDMQIWRRVDSNPYLPDSCETGMRPEAGYSLIAEVPVDAGSYMDDKLALGAKYCYRLVAVFEDNIEAESVVSEEQCFEFVPGDAPIITHVSVVRTAPDNGQIRVSWKKPYDLDPSIVGDFEYDIYRAVGFSGTDNYQLAGQVTNDTTFLDQGLNTEDRIYNYRIVFSVPGSVVGDAPIDTSSVASTVRLDPSPDFDQVELSWEAEVPWSNTITSGEGQYHYIYRGQEGAEVLGDLTLLDSVKVVETGFSYIDDNDLDNDQVYCYAVLTRGTYGNPQIQSPLDNLSQIICVQPVDTIAPCIPNFELNGIDCSTYGSDYGCDFNNFQNELFWSPDPAFTCQNDIRLYEVFYASTTTGEFEKIAEVRDTFYVHTPQNQIAPLSSFKGCYKIRALDRSGNYSEFTEVFCFDNCPNYELPNVFTPDGDGCNDVFSAFRVKGFEDENGAIVFPCGEVDPSRCARFVRSVEFVVVNRWGKEVFNYSSGGENTIYIDWDGKDNNGGLLASGVYYYVAKVTFDVVDPAEAVQEIKGWVHIIR